MDSNAVTRWIAVAGLTAVAICLVWKGEYASALTVAAMVTPGAVQMPKIAAPAAAGALLLLFALGASAVACSAATPKRVNAVERRIECVLEHRSMSPEQAAALCLLESPQDVVDIITGEDRRIGSARAIGESQGRMLGCAPSKR